MDQSAKHKRKILIFGIAILGVSIALISWQAAQFTTRRSPKLHIPAPILPSPNAYTYYVAAGKFVFEGSYASGTKRSLSDPKAQKEASIELQKNAHALALLHQGFQYAYYQPPARFLSSFSPSFSKYRSLARVLSLQARLSAAQGHWGTSINSSLDGIQLGQSIPHGNAVIGLLVGVACQSIGRKPAWKSVDHLTAAECLADVKRLEDIERLHLSYADVLQNEKWTTLSDMDTYLNGFQHPGWQFEFIRDGGLKQYHNDPHILFVTKTMIMSHYTLRMDAEIAAARGPYGTSVRPTPSDIFNDAIIIGYSEVRVRDAETEALNRLLLVNLALHAYWLEHKHYPVTLADLKPGYLHEIPLDPFSANAPLGYKKVNDQYVLYSIGPDQKDDGGTPISSKYIEINSKGDIVAGVNK